mmetsp:Transcript_13068/g.19268  ORF Transcript_13068/g.19268 Transcript_13068/m.19268 type:complete len:208 (-) Transcript_13068:296-919(-)
MVSITQTERATWFGRETMRGHLIPTQRLMVGPQPSWKGTISMAMTTTWRPPPPSPPSQRNLIPCWRSCLLRSNRHNKCAPCLSYTNRCIIAFGWTVMCREIERSAHGCDNFSTFPCRFPSWTTTALRIECGLFISYCRCGYAWEPRHQKRYTMTFEDGSKSKLPTKSRTLTITALQNNVVLPCNVWKIHRPLVASPASSMDKNSLWP